MTDNDHEGKQTGPLARIGQNDSFAGITRIGILFLPVLLTGIIGWAASDMKSMLSRIDENQNAIIAIGNRTTRVEDAAALALSSGHEFRTWTEGRVNDLTSGLNADGRLINDIDRKQAETTNRVRCLENRTRCPP